MKQEKRKLWHGHLNIIKSIKISGEKRPICGLKAWKAIINKKKSHLIVGYVVPSSLKSNMYTCPFLHFWMPFKQKKIYFVVMHTQVALKLGLCIAIRILKNVYRALNGEFHSLNQHQQKRGQGLLSSFSSENTSQLIQLNFW